MFSGNSIFYASILAAELILILSLRHLRGLFQSPGIGSSQSIGYSQFYNYPIFFDFVLFFLMCAVPVVLAFIFGKILKRHVN